MKLTAILCLTLASPFHLVMAQNFTFPPITIGSGEVIAIHPALCGMLDDVNPPMPIPIICAKYLGSAQTKGYLGVYGKWCVTTMESEAVMRSDCTFSCDDMNLNNTSLELPISLEQRNLELPMSLEQRLPDEADIGVTLDIIDEWMVELLETGGNEVENLLVFEQAMQLYDAFWLMSLEQRLTVTDLSPDEQLAILDEGMVELSKEGRNVEVLDQLMQLYDTFMLSVYACKLHECEDVAQCQRIADMTFKEILEYGIELDIDMDAFDSLEDARELARRLDSHL